MTDNNDQRRVFISYSHADASFVDRLQKRLATSGFSVWLDRRDLIAGDISRQLVKSLDSVDAVVLLLSQSSVKSDWCWFEIEKARKREHKESRDILCPIAIDDAWCNPHEYYSHVEYMIQRNEPSVRYLKQRLVIQFEKSRLNSAAFNKLARGLVAHFEEIRESEQRLIQRLVDKIVADPRLSGSLLMLVCLCEHATGIMSVSKSESDRWEVGVSIENGRGGSAGGAIPRSWLTELTDRGYLQTNGMAEYTPTVSGMKFVAELQDRLASDERWITMA